MSTRYLSTKFVGGPANRYRCTIRSIVLHGPLDQLGLRRRAGVLSASGLCLHYAALGLVGERIVAAIVAKVPVLADDLFRLPEIFLAVGHCDKCEDDLKVDGNFRRKFAERVADELRFYFLLFFSLLVSASLGSFILISTKVKNV